MPSGRRGAIALGRLRVAGLRGRDDAAVEPYSLPWVTGRERAYRWSLALSDVVATALVLGLTLDFQRSPAFIAAYVAVLAIVVLWAKLNRLYDRDDLKVHKTTLEEVPRLFGLATTLVLVYVLFERAMDPAFETAAPWLLTAWLGLARAMTVGLAVTRQILERAHGQERCLVLGDPDTARDLVDRIGGRGHVGVVRSLPIDVETTSRHHLAAVVCDERIDRVILAPADSASGDLKHWPSAAPSSPAPGSASCRRPAASPA